MQKKQLIITIIIIALLIITTVIIVAVNQRQTVNKPANETNAIVNNVIDNNEVGPKDLTEENPNSTVATPNEENII